MHPEKKLWFSSLCVKNGLVLTDLQVEQLDQYVDLLLNWNKKINLISRKDEENIWNYHILHSVSLLFRVKLMEGCRIVDIGTGGGLPGIPLKILRPDISLLCIDATRKKANAVMEMIEDLKIKNIKVVWGRAEEIGKQAEHLHKFDFAVARAVCQLNELISMSINFLKEENYAYSFENIVCDGPIEPNPPALIAFKGGDLTQEIGLAKRRYPRVSINSVNLAFIGSEHLIASDKKILIVHI